MYQLLPFFTKTKKQTVKTNKTEGFDIFDAFLAAYK